MVRLGPQSILLVQHAGANAAGQITTFEEKDFTFTFPRPRKTLMLMGDG